MSLPSESVKRPVLIGIVFMGFVFLGSVSLLRLPVELYQGLQSGIVSIIIRARGGLAPREVEHMITRPVEEAVSTVSRLKAMYSNSREAESRVTLEFLPGTDMDFASLEVREKFSRVKAKLPPEVEKPVVANYSELEGAVISFAVISKTKTPEEIRAVVDSELKPLLERLNGVASVEVYGGRERKILVELDRDKMAAYQISVEEVMDIIGAANINLLAGDYERGTYEFAIRTMGAFEDIKEIGEIGVKVSRQGTIIPLKEIATVKDSYLESEDFSRLNLSQNVSVYVKKISVSNTIEVVESVKAVLTEYNKLKEEEIQTIVVSDRAQSIKRAINDVRDSLFLGMFLVSIIIFLILRSLSLALIVLTAIPVSVVSTFLFMGLFGFSLNVMTLSGIAISIGILVDSAVVVIENYFSKREQGLGHLEAVVKGADEMWLALTASLFTNLIVFLPIVFIDKQVQIQYGGFAFTVCATQILSLLAAISLVPMLISRVRARGRAERDGSEGVRPHEMKMQGVKIRSIYEQLMRFAFKTRYPILLLVLSLFGMSAWGLAHRDIDLPSTLEENEFKIVIFPLAGAKLETNDEVVKKLESMLAEFKEVELISSTVRKVDVQILVRLKPRNERVHSKDEIMTLMKEKGNEEIKKIHEEYSLIVDEGVSSEETRKMVVNIFGLENDELERLAHEFAQRMSQIAGLTNLVMTDLRKRPEYSLVVDKARAAHYGVTVKNVADSVHALVRGMRPTKFHEIAEGKEIEVITRLQPIYRQKIDDLRYLNIVSPSDKSQVKLEQIASFFPSHGPQTIDRRNKYRYVFVKGDTSKAMETIGKQIKAILRDVQMPKDYFWRFGGGYEDLLKGRSQSWIALIITVGLVYMLLGSFFQSFSQPLMIMTAIPMGSIGVWLGLTMTGKPLSQNVFLGMILLAGYVVNNSIILIDRMNHLKNEVSESRERLILAGQSRLRPILITTTATVLGFFPMAISSGESSAIWAPLAVTVIGGILSSTVLTLIIVPLLFLYLDDLKKIVLRKSPNIAR